MLNPLRSRVVWPAHDAPGRLQVQAGTALIDLDAQREFPGVVTVIHRSMHQVFCICHVYILRRSIPKEY
ncbi:hypothetical protein [Methyloversatilis sp.]|uniref:hypothetical protein n=1 Tax=Methyloversatilis sp. TaxID=2569862 RepID=UPI00273743BC|nr:hypothetical protein [Methyloversatilis sp.]